MGDSNGTSALRAQMFQNLTGVRKDGKLRNVWELKVFANWTSDLTSFPCGVGLFVVMWGLHRVLRPDLGNPLWSSAGWTQSRHMRGSETAIAAVSLYCSGIFLFLLGCKCMWKLDLLYLWSLADASLIKSPLNLEMLIKTGRYLKLALSTKWRSYALQAH